MCFHLQCRDQNKAHGHFWLQAVRKYNPITCLGNKPELSGDGTLMPTNTKGLRSPPQLFPTFYWEKKSSRFLKQIPLRKTSEDWETDFLKSYSMEDLFIAVSTARNFGPDDRRSKVFKDTQWSENIIRKVLIQNFSQIPPLCLKATKWCGFYTERAHL